MKIHILNNAIIIMFSLHLITEKLADEQIELADFDRSDGPLTKHLDVVLKEMNFERHAYHGKSFIGNHVHTCCKVTYIQT